VLVCEPERERMATLTFSGAARFPVWTPDGKHLVFLILDRYNKIGWVRADGSSRPEVLLGRQEGMVPVEPNCFTPDGKRLLFTATGPQSGRDIWMLPLDWTDPDHPIAGKPEPLLHSPAPEESGAISPDGRWLAYSSMDAPGAQHQIFVQPFPTTGGKWLVSNGGASNPVWSRHSSELFFLSEEGRLMAAPYRVEGGSFVLGSPRAWSQAAVPVSGGWYDMMPDAKRAIFIRPSNDKERATRRLTFLTNFPDELRRHAVSNP
jgi:eukaryotic-like serine/threonine-protein kinase